MIGCWTTWAVVTSRSASSVSSCPGGEGTRIGIGGNMAVIGAE